MMQKLRRRVADAQAADAQNSALQAPDLVTEAARNAAPNGDVLSALTSVEAEGENALWTPTTRAALDAYPRIEASRDFNARVLQRLEARAQPTWLDRLDKFFARPLPRLMGSLGLGTALTLPALAFIAVNALSGAQRSSSATPAPRTMASSPRATAPLRSLAHLGGRPQTLARLIEEAEKDADLDIASSPERSHAPQPKARAPRSPQFRSSSCPNCGVSLA